MSATHDLYEEVKSQLRKTIELLGLGEEVYEILSVPERLIQVSIPVKMDDGSTRVFVGWRSQHNSALGPYKGGVRYAPDATANEAIALSMLMTWKNSLAGLPYGGGKGAVRVDPFKLSPRELERLSRGYFEAISDFVGVDLDIPAPDLNTNPQVMAWFLDSYVKMKRGYYFGVVTGKPADLGGINTRTISTGYGVAVAAREIAKKLWGGLEGKTVAVQGYGNVGYHATKFLHQMGAQIIAIGDIGGALMDPKGVDIEEARKWAVQTGTIIHYQKPAKRISNQELLELDVDILVPAAVENVITEANADKIKAKLIVEGANGPTTPGADEILSKKGITVVPDILANAGGVIMSHIEWVNNRMGGWITDEEALKKLEQQMTSNVQAVWDYWHSKLDPNKYNMRTAAQTIAVDRVVRAMRLRGWI